YVLQVRAQEKRPVFAYAATAAPWLQIGRVQLDGRTASIPLKVPSVPDRRGEPLRGKVHVTANGGHRFLVEIALTPLSAALPVLTASDVVAEVETIPEAVAVGEEVVSLVP